VVAFRPFWRPGGALPRPAREVPWPMLAGPVLLAGLGALFGIYTDLLETALVAPMVISLTGSPSEVKDLTLWAGVNLPLALSIATFVLGLALYAGHRPLRALLDRGLSRLPGLDAGWDRFIDGLKSLAAWQTRMIQTGRLTQYLFVTFATILAGLTAGLAVLGLPPLPPDPDGLSWIGIAPLALILAGAGLTIGSGSRIAGIASLGVIGIAIALVFLLYGAPDVAITQLLAETLVVVLVSVALLRLPLMPRDRFRPSHAALATGLGAAVTVILLAVLATPLDLRLTAFFEAASWPEAYGRNIVNVILVDFRALDTFGEIAVVVVAALSAYALLRSGKEPPK
jgi:multicomponent Na+:H+ antiporter subunit A